jgi:hypothetical protein
MDRKKIQSSSVFLSAYILFICGLKNLNLTVLGGVQGHVLALHFVAHPPAKQPAFIPIFLAKQPV